jgi:hypothetical protein
MPCPYCRLNCLMVGDACDLAKTKLNKLLALGNWRSGLGVGFGGRVLDPPLLAKFLLVGAGCVEHDHERCNVIGLYIPIN